MSEEDAIRHERYFKAETERTRRAWYEIRVGEMAEILAELQDTDIILPSQTYHMAIVRGGYYVGDISLGLKTIDWYDEEEYLPYDYDWTNPDWTQPWPFPAKGDAAQIG